MRAIITAATLSFSASAIADTVACHLTDGGETPVM